MHNVNSKKLTAWIAAAAVVFVMLFSLLYISEHADHDCTGAECSVCAVMEQCSNNIKNIGIMVAVVVTAIFLYLSAQKGMQQTIDACSDGSLISQKVRMNN